jgi:molybdenum-dependent DNA-binding transcriptional regulator ModE
VEPPNAYCWWHDPANATQRKRAAAKGGKSKPNREIRDYKQEVRDLIAAVENGGQDRADAAVMLQGYRLLKDFVELERKVRELDDLEARIEQLEQANGDGEEKRWGT